MEATFENISLIVIALTSLIVVGSIAYEVLPAQVKVLKPGIMVRTEDSEFSGGRTWLILSVTSDGAIDSITVEDSSGNACDIDSIHYTGRTIKVYGFCDGNLKGDVLIVLVETNGRTFNYNVRI